MESNRELRNNHSDRPCDDVIVMLTPQIKWVQCGLWGHYLHRGQSHPYSLESHHHHYHQGPIPRARR